MSELEPVSDNRTEWSTLMSRTKVTFIAFIPERSGQSALTLSKTNCATAASISLASKPIAQMSCHSLLMRSLFSTH